MWCSTGKDLNFGTQLHLTREKQIQLAAQLCKDADFLASINSLDYSLLLGAAAACCTPRLVIDCYSGVHNQKNDIDKGQRMSILAAETSSSKRREVDRQLRREQTGGDELLLEQPITNLHGGLDAIRVEGPVQYFVAIIDLFKEWDW